MKERDESDRPGMATERIRRACTDQINDHTDPIQIIEKNKQTKQKATLNRL